MTQETQLSLNVGQPTNESIELFDKAYEEANARIKKFHDSVIKQ